MHTKIIHPACNLAEEFNLLNAFRLIAITMNLSLSLGKFFATFILICVWSSQVQSMEPLDDRALSQWWQQHPDPASWSQAIPAIREQIQSAYQQDPHALRDSSNLFDWFYHLQWLQLQGAIDDKLENRSAYIQVGSSTKLRNTLLNHLHPHLQSL